MSKMSDELQVIMDFEKDNNYLRKHFKEYQERYGGQYVAVFKEKLIAVDPELNKNIEKIKEQGIDPSFVLIEFIPKVGTIILL